MQDIQKAKSRHFPGIISDQLYNAIIAADLDHKIIYTNKAFRELYGYSQEELLGQTQAILNAESKFEQIRKDIYKKVSSGMIWRGKVLNRKKDGSKFNCELTVFPLVDREGKIFAYASNQRDVTELKREAKQLRESEKKYRLIIDSLNEGICVINKNERISFVNEKMSEMLGYTAYEMIGKSIYDFMDKHGKKVYQNIIEQQKEVSDEQYDLELIKNDESRINVMMGVSPIYDANGEYTGGVVEIVDITCRKKMEEAMLKAKNDLEKRIEERNVAVEECNTALNVLLEKRDVDKKKIEENVLLNIKHTISPYLEKLKMNISESNKHNYINVIETNLKKIVSSFSNRLSSNYSGVSPKEIQVAHLLMEGKQSKEIAQILNTSVDTVNCQRQSIRKKLGILNKKVNLRSHLLSLEK